MEYVENQTVWTSDLKDLIDIKEEPLEFKEEHLECYKQVKNEIFSINDNQDKSSNEVIRPEIGFSSEDIKASRSMLASYRDTLEDKSFLTHHITLKEERLDYTEEASELYALELKKQHTEQDSEDEYEMSKHDNSSNKCKICDKTFADKFGAKRHLEIHYATKRYFCAVCNRAFLRRADRKTHQLQHSEPAFACKNCRKKYHTKSSLNRHTRACRMKQLNIPVNSCTICAETFATRARLREHRLLHFPKRYPCTVCPSRFNKKFDLAAHLKLHRDVKEYACTYCAKSFVDQPRLNRHMLNHLEAQHACDICNKRFTQKETLKRHRLTHFDVRHTCAVCNKQFTQKNALTRHMAIHKGVRYFCDICNKSFSQKSDLNLHISKHHI